MDVRVLVVSLAWAVGLAGLFAGLVRLFRRREPPGIGAVALALLITCGVAFPALVVVTRVARLDVFGVASLVWWTIIVGIPLAGILVLAQHPRRAVAWIAWGAVVVPLVLSWWGMRIEPSKLEVVETAVAVPNERAGVSPVRVGVISDIQFRQVGDHEREAVERLSAEHPDVIVVAGDIYQGPQDGFEAQLPAIRSLLGGLQAPGGVYLVGGDVDQPETRLAQVVEGTDVRWLHNEIVDVPVGDRTVRIGGVELSYASPAAKATIEELRTAPGDEVRLLVAHRPDVVLGLPLDDRIDLTIAGHTHGGQISVPGIGPLATASGVPRAMAAGGLHEHQGNQIFVTTGVGMERSQAPPVRLGVPPTIGVLTLSSGL